MKKDFMRVYEESHEIDIYGDAVTYFYITAWGYDYRLEQRICGAYDTETGEELGGTCARVTLYEVTFNDTDIMDTIYNALDDLGLYELFMDADTVYNCSPEIRRFIEVTSWGCQGDEQDITNFIIGTLATNHK